MPIRPGLHAEVSTLRTTAAALDELLEHNGTDPDQLAAEFTTTRPSASTPTPDPLTPTTPENFTPTPTPNPGPPPSHPGTNQCHQPTHPVHLGRYQRFGGLRGKPPRSGASVTRTNRASLVPNGSDYR